MASPTLRADAATQQSLSLDTLVGEDRRDCTPLWVAICNRLLLRHHDACELRAFDARDMESDSRIRFGLELFIRADEVAVVAVN